MIVPLCIPIYATNPLCLARSNLDALSTYAFPVQLTHVFINVDPAFYILDDSKGEACYIWVNIWLLLYVGYYRKWRSTKANYTLISALISFSDHIHTQKHTHTHTRRHFDLSGMILCTLFCDTFISLFPSHLPMSEHVLTHFWKAGFKKWNSKVMHVFVSSRYHQTASKKSKQLHSTFCMKGQDSSYPHQHWIIKEKSLYYEKINLWKCGLVFVYPIRLETFLKYLFLKFQKYM